MHCFAYSLILPGLPSSYEIVSLVVSLPPSPTMRSSGPTSRSRPSWSWPRTGNLWSFMWHCREDQLRDIQDPRHLKSRSDIHWLLWLEPWRWRHTRLLISRLRNKIDSWKCVSIGDIVGWLKPRRWRQRISDLVFIILGDVLSWFLNWLQLSTHCQP